VTGKVKNVYPLTGSANVRIILSGGSQVAIMDGRLDLQCYVAQGQIQAARALRAGDVVKLSGVCEGANAAYIVFRDCVIVEAE